MRKREVEIGGRYWAKVSGSRVAIKILRNSPFGGWVARNLKTQREVRIRTAARLTLLPGAVVEVPAGYPRGVPDEGEIL